jgi:succinyl-CoA synthetase alpha subunit
MIIRRTHRVLVWGMTGRQAGFWTERMIACGTQVVGGVNPARAGTSHLGLPVFASGAAARDAGADIDVALLFVPPHAVAGAAADAIDAGARLVVILAEHVPLHDTLTVHALARRAGARVIGPNTAGLVTPGEAFAGIMPAFNPRIFRPGHTGVVSRSGSLGTLACLELTRGGLGQSTFIGIGGDPIPGTGFREALEALDDDPRTDAMVLVGEIGGSQEQDAARTAAGLSKPVVAFIAGASAPPGRRMGHAGAIIGADGDSYAAKRQALEAAGVPVADTPGQIPDLVRQVLTIPVRRRRA